ncbi:MAG: hypothetical protein ABEN55_13695 [Bradymonadaceae bacterium]
MTDPDCRSRSSTPHAARWLTALGLVSVALLIGPSTALAVDDSVPDLSGTWARKTVQTSVTDLPILGDTTSKTTSYVLVDIEQTGRRVSWSARTCEATIDGDIGAVRTILPDAFVDAIPVSNRSGRLVTDEEDETRLKMEPDHIVMGAALGDPANDPLPSSADDLSVTDDDHDGKPGVTIRMEGLLSGRVYVVRRATSRYSATVEDPDRFRGLVDWETDRRILKSTNSLLANDRKTEPHSDARKSWFEMRRLDTKITCSQLRSRTDDLFGD